MSRLSAWILIIGLVVSFTIGAVAGFAAMDNEPEEYFNLKILTIFLPWAAITSFPFYTTVTIIELCLFFKRNKKDPTLSGN